MIAQVLEKPPLSGSIEEILFEAFGECTWIKFSNDDEEWAGVFGNGHFSSAQGVAVFPSGNYAFVIAKGKGYLINLTNRSLILKIGDTCLEYVVAVPEQDIVIILCASRTLIGCDSSGTLWESEFSDGDSIQLISVTKEAAYGRVWVPPDDAWYSFRYNIHKRTFENITFLTNEEIP